MAHKRVQKPEVRRRQILEAAQETLKDKPYSRLSMDDIAREAGISKGLLYLYFKDKESLFAEVTCDLIDQLTERLLAIPDDSPPRKRLESMIETILAFGEDHKELTVQFIPEQIMSSEQADRIMDRYKKFVRMLEGFFLDGIKIGLLRTHLPRTSAMIVMEILMLTARRKFLYKEINGPLIKFKNEIVSILIDGFGARAGDTK